MLNLKVYGEEESNKTVTLRLEKDGNCITLWVVDENGRRVKNGNLLVITANGTICRLCLVPRDFGFQLDDYRRIVIDG